MKPIYIFDLDGTLALIEHRRHLVEGPKKDWRAFFAACVDDKPNQPVIDTLKSLRKSAEVWVWSGRSDEVQRETLQWLHKHGVFHSFWNPLKAPEQFRMRKAGDHRSDVELKFGWLSEIEPPEYKRLTAVFDDRDCVVKMWRDSGIPCFQVAPGDF
ncbi:phosphatase domain-containing protein [Trinickia mobilis]|uniref:phosphatase domain-containing protein n=1 Tax=Trinickia mobilis TaxID=2816356 RepID=UPI001A8F6508|nr:hypothetical protein [Trinickia mobilis]